MNVKSVACLTVAVVLLCAAGPAAGGNVRQVKVLTDKAPDCTSRKALVESVTRGCKTNDEKAIAIYNAYRLLIYHRQYPGERGGIAALKLFNVYGWSLCGGQHAALSSLWVTAGWKHRFLGWSGHTTVEAFYDDQWHYFDTFLKFYCWRADPNAPGGRTVASQKDIADNPDLIRKGMVYDEARRVWYPKDNRFEIINDKANWVAPAFLVCGDGAPGVISGCKGRRPGGPSKGWMGIKHAEDGYNTDVNLAPGYSLELMWKSIEGAHWFSGRKYVPIHSCGDKEYRNCPAIGPILEPYRYLNSRGARRYSNGRLTFRPNLSNDAFLSGLVAKENVKVAGGALAPADANQPASITVPLSTPYIMTRAYGEAEGVDLAEISTDGGKTFKPVKLKDFSDAVGGKYDAQLRLGFKQPVKGLKLEVIVQHNRCAPPYLSPGPNKVTVSVADPKALGDNKLVVTYAYALGSRRVPYEGLAEREAELGRAHKASWSATPTVVQKVFAAGDLPATFDIPVPTPTKAHPVYPRMLFLRREIVAPGGKPLPLPDGALRAKVGADQKLKTLPNPFLMGIAKPPKKVERPKTTRKIALKCSHVVHRTKDGKTSEETFDNFHIKWRPKSPEAWVMLVGGELKGLPKVRDIAGARLCIPVTHATPQTTTQVGVTLLRKPFQAGKPYDFKDLGGVAGTVNVPKQAQPGPAKYFKIEITRALKNIAAGEAKFHGLSIRTIPNRSVDEGWTTRIDVSKADPIYIELDVFTDKPTK